MTIIKKLGAALILSAGLVASAGADAATIYDWSYDTTVPAGCSAYCSGYEYGAVFHASGWIELASDIAPTSIIDGGGTLTVTGADPAFNGTYTLSDLVFNPNAPDTTDTGQWVYDNIIPLDAAGGPLFSDALGNQFNIWDNGALPANIIENVPTSEAGLSLAGDPAGEDYLDNQGTFVISAVPEPATWAMFLLGFGAVGFVLRAARGKKVGAAVTA